MRKKIIESHSNNTNTLNYSGDITLKILDGDRVISTKEYHNTGTQKLFNFFGSCLRGEFRAAKSIRPCRVILFEAGTGEIKDSVPTAEYWNKNTKASTAVYYDSTPVVLDTEDGDGTTVQYHFRLPFLSLRSGAIITKVGLYPSIYSDEAGDLCAYYYLDQDSYINVPLRGGNYTIVIDWKLTIKNK